MLNTKYKADVVVEAAIGGYNLWVNDHVVSTMSQAGYDFIIARIANQQCSIFDLAKGQFISGDLAQLSGEAA